MGVLLFPVFVLLVIGIFFPRKREGYMMLAFFALLLGAVMSWTISEFVHAFNPGCVHREDCTALILQEFITLLLILEPFPIVAAVFRRFSLAARNRGELQAARMINGAGLALVILGFAVLVGWGLR